MRSLTQEHAETEQESTKISFTFHPTASHKHINNSIHTYMSKQGVVVQSTASSSSGDLPIVHYSHLMNTGTGDHSHTHDHGHSHSGHDHNHSHNNEEEGHKSSGDYLKSIVYGGLDGILTAFAVVVGAAGGNLRPEVILVLGVSSLFAEALSMGICDTISTMSYIEHVKHEARREEWEFDNFAEGEISEMVDLYVNRGLPREKAEIVITTMAKYRDFFISIMVLEELELKIPDPNDNPYKDGFVTFASFLLFGISPIIGYVIVPLIIPGVDPEVLLGIAFLTTSVSLFGLGVFKSGFSAMPWWKSGLEFLFLGGIVALSSFSISVGISRLVFSGMSPNPSIAASNATNVEDRLLGSL